MKYFFLGLLIGFIITFTISVLAWQNPTSIPPSGGGYIQTQEKNLLITAPGNVGIGTTEPGAKLDVNGNIRVQGWDAVYQSFDNILNKQFHLIGTYHGWDPYGVYITGYNYYNSPNVSQAKKIYFGGGGTERMVIDLSSGNVGIGTTAPGAKLHVASGLIETGARGVRQNLNFVDSCGTTRVIRVHNGIWGPDYSGGCGDEWFIGVQDRDGGEASTLVIGMWNDANDHIALMPSGNVGIGTTNPSQKLDVAGNIATNDVYLRSVGKWASQLGGGNAYLSGNGYVELPGGVIIQWGVFNCGYTWTSCSKVIYLPRSFPNYFAVVVVTHRASDPGDYSYYENNWSAIPLNNNSFQFTWQPDGWRSRGPSSYMWQYIAIGY